MLTPLQRHLCDEWHALTRAAEERAQEIQIQERHLAALQQAYAQLRRQIEAIGAVFQVCDLRTAAGPGAGPGPAPVAAGPLALREGLPL